MRRGGNIPRQWSEGELRRMQRMVEAGALTRAQIGIRFACSEKSITTLMHRYGWQQPRGHAKRATITRAFCAHSIHKAREAKRKEDIATLDQRMADAGCRSLEGREFEYWAAIYMKRDRKQRERAARRG